MEQRSASSPMVQLEQGQPAAPTLTLRPFQARELEFLEGPNRVGITWDMGLGKTAIASTLGARRKHNRWLIICPDNAFTTWQKEAPRWITQCWPEVKII